MENNADEFLTTKHVRARYGGKSDKTIDRWIAQGVLPPPLIINGRRHWRRSDLEHAERAGMNRRQPGTAA
jgi:predicted DNA-binding transcriptional regulator AlpA